jgi:hypothetical protein
MVATKELEETWDQQHVLATILGVVFLSIAAVWIVPQVNFNWRAQLWSIAFIVISAVGIDSTVHALFTEPEEIDMYWAFKALSGVTAVIWMMSRRFSTQSVIMAAVFFASLISAWYRSLEIIWKLVTGEPKHQAGIVGGHVPTFVLGSHRVEFSEHPLLSSLMWGLVHTSAFAIPSFFVKKTILH